MIANGATRGLDNPASVKLDYAVAWYSWMIPEGSKKFSPGLDQAPWIR